MSKKNPVRLTTNQIFIFQLKNRISIYFVTTPVGLVAAALLFI